jgi:hypothetical protein
MDKSYCVPSQKAAIVARRGEFYFSISFKLPRSAKLVLVDFREVFENLLKRELKKFRLPFVRETLCNSHQQGERLVGQHTEST